MEETVFNWDKDWSIWTYSGADDESPIVHKYTNKRDALKSYCLYTRRDDSSLQIKIRKGREDITATIEKFISSL